MLPMEIIKTPNLPTGKVITAISAAPVPAVNCIPTMALPILPPSLSTHADLQICHVGENVLVASPEVYAYYKEKLSPLGFVVLCGENKVGCTYPKDAAYNVARIGNVAFHNLRFTEPRIVETCKKMGVYMVHVEQGYAKCAVVPIGDSALITADGGIARAARAEKMDVLEILPGHITLSGFSYGFIGGAMALLSKDVAYCTGSLANHPSKMEIFDFLKKYGIKIEEGSIPIPIDIGSILPLQTK